MNRESVFLVLAFALPASARAQVEPEALVREAFAQLGALHQDPQLRGLDLERALKALRAHATPTLDEAHGVLRAELAHFSDRATRFFAADGLAALIADVTGGAQSTVGLPELLSLDLDERNGDVVIVTPRPKSPAALAGILPGDRVLAVDGRSAAESGVAEILRRLREERGATLTLGRGEERLTAKLVRVDASTGAPRVESRAVEFGGRRIGYLALRNFSPGVGDEARRALDELTRPHVDALVLDLRGNPGGGLPESLSVAGAFLGELPIALRVGRGDVRTTLTATGPRATELPTAVLVDEGTASAAELLASGLRSQHRAKLVGARTFGKALVHELVPLPDGSALLVTTGRLLASDGGELLHVGVTPDVLVASQPELTLRETTKLATQDDLAFARAVDELASVPKR
ncbi:MAG: PDZ domain-containing protein [Planctomycetes bacterium]|nr:PDZ domain-containing protein [Planctomycetota bacterium]